MLAIHMTLAYLSVAGFVLRVGWAYTAPDMLQHKLVRVAPHVVDTLLLLFGVLLALNLPDGLLTGWLLAKLAALLAYIGFGVMALRGAGRVRLFGTVAALLSVGYLMSVAYTRSAWPF